MEGGAWSEDTAAGCDNGKHGTLFTACLLIISAVGGVGALALPLAVAWLGWIAGPILIAAYGAKALYSAHLLRRLYIIDGIEFARYHHCVKYVLGDRAAMVVAALQSSLMFMGTVAYLMAGGEALAGALARLDAPIFAKTWQCVLLLAALQLALSQIPSLADLWFVGGVATLLAGAYCAITFILGCLCASNGGGTLGGIPPGQDGVSTADKAFGVLSSLGTLAFAFAFAEITLEIADTLRQPPSAVATMGSAYNVSVPIVVTCYMGIGVTCYLALGNQVPSFVLNGFLNEPGVPEWLPLLAQLMVAIQTQLIFQIWAQPMFDSIESYMKAFRLKKLAAAEGGDSLHHQHAQEALWGKATHLKLGSKPSTDSSEDEAGKRDGAASGGADVEAGAARYAAARAATLARAMSSGMRCRTMAARGSGDHQVLNTAPIPDLIPADWKPNERYLKRFGGLAGLTRGGAAAVAAEAMAEWQAAVEAAAARGGLSPQASRALSQRASGAVSLSPQASGVASLSPQASGALPRSHTQHRAPAADSAGGRLRRSVAGMWDPEAMALNRGTAATNEHVPLNDTGYLLPWWQRCLVRCTYVLLVAAVTVLVPFFYSMLSFIGTFLIWPLGMGFPCAMTRKVGGLSGRQKLLMAVVESLSLLAAIGGGIGAIRNIIVGWENITYFS